jgi:AcrR family transcriptional regulator
MNRLEKGLPGDPACPQAPTLRRRRSRQTRSLILQSAVQLFAQHPYEAVSLREITGLLQLNISLVKFYFGNKEALHLEALRYACQAGLEEVQRLPLPPNPEDPGAAGGAARALEANLAMFVALGKETRRSGVVGTAPALRSAALALLGRALGSARPEVREALGPLVAAHRDHLDACVRALRPDLGCESRFRIGSSLVGQGCCSSCFPTW